MPLAGELAVLAAIQARDIATITHPKAVSIWRMGFLLLFDYYAGPQIAALSSVSIFQRKLIVFFAGAAETTSSDRAGLDFAYGDTNDNVNALVTNPAPQYHGH